MAVGPRGPDFRFVLSTKAEGRSLYEERQCSRCVRIIPSVVAASAIVLSAGFSEPKAECCTQTYI